ATSVYLPQKVIPMFPEVISNGLASLQEGKLRYVKTVRMEFTPNLQKADVRFFNVAIRNRRRFTYDEVQTILDNLDGGGGDRGQETGDRKHKSQGTGDAAAPLSPVPCLLSPELRAMLRRMRDLALLLRKKRMRRGSLELNM